MIYLGADNHKPASAIVIRVDQAVGEHFAHGLVNRCNSANVRSDDEAGNTDGISGDTVRNIISFNNLVPELMQMVHIAVDNVH